MDKLTCVFIEIDNWSTDKNSRIIYREFKITNICECMAKQNLVAILEASTFRFRFRFILKLIKISVSVLEESKELSRESSLFNLHQKLRILPISTSRN